MTTSTACPVCGAAFQPVRRQRYCSQACRQAAYRRRLPAAPVIIPATGHRRDITIYACTDCEQRYLAEQWCPDCQRPCIRVGYGGLCPHCDEPVAVDDLLAQQQPAPFAHYAQPRPTKEAGSQ